MRVLSFMFCAVLLMGASAAWAYDEIQVTERRNNRREGNDGGSKAQAQGI